MDDKWDVVVEDEDFEDPLILPDGLAEDTRPDDDRARAEAACDRENALLAKDADRDLRAKRAPRRPASRARTVSSPSAPRTTGG